MKFSKIAAGHYATEDGTYAVVVDGYNPVKSVGSDSHYEGFQGGEWAAVFSPSGGLRENANDGDNLEWFPTKREAVQECERHAERHATRSAVNHWNAGDDARCTCLTRDDHSLAHAVRCEVVSLGQAITALTEGTPEVDRTDIRELAEIAANSDIDTALHIYRAWAEREQQR